MLAGKQAWIATYALLLLPLACAQPLQVSRMRVCH
jgi:hypothetical protein